MIIKCPHCNTDIKIDYESDVDANMYNFNGDELDVEIDLYCEYCEKCCLAIVHYEISPVGESKVYKR